MLTPVREKAIHAAIYARLRELLTKRNVNIEEIDEAIQKDGSVKFANVTYSYVAIFRSLMITLHWSKGKCYQALDDCFEDVPETKEVALIQAKRSLLIRLIAKGILRRQQETRE